MNKKIRRLKMIETGKTSGTKLKMSWRIFMILEAV